MDHKLFQYAERYMWQPRSTRLKQKFYMQYMIVRNI